MYEKYTKIFNVFKIQLISFENQMNRADTLKVDGLQSVEALKHVQHRGSSIATLDFCIPRAGFVANRRCGVVVGIRGYKMKGIGFGARRCW